MSFPPLPLLCSQHRLVDNYCDRHQNEPEGEDQVGHCVPHSPALCTLAWVVDFTMTVARRKRKVLPQVCSYPPLDRPLQYAHLSVHTCVASVYTGEECGGPPRRLRKASESLGIQMTALGDQTAGPQAPGQDPAMGALVSLASNSRELGDKTERGRGWEDFEHVIFPHQEWVVLQELEVSLGAAPSFGFPRVGRCMAASGSLGLGSGLPAAESNQQEQVRSLRTPVSPGRLQRGLAQHRGPELPERQSGA